ncbi:interferon alpha beta receptor 2-like isoform X1 [Solea senegalensis]|uniref:Interferon alpha beta receptor 2-like isoform X1 n=1 Tax=Solea senegalensis TaxID=28829 RepID=A0AAV6RFM1_SOLSE|nr:interferon alpha beta receptor 2-like isoform X1 [Solea senegalensis]
MQHRIFVLLNLHFVAGILLSPPSNVAISSFNMEHTVKFLPGPGTPTETHFTVQIINYRKNSWRLVSGCSELTAGQMCNVTRAFKDQYNQYKARVQAFTATQTSNWTVSRWFQPLSDSETLPTHLHTKHRKDTRVNSLHVVHGNHHCSIFSDD